MGRWVVAGVLVVAGCGVPGDGAAARLKWSDCEDGFECAALRVPLDYAHPGDEHLRLSVVRLPASGSRTGSLVVNPGGPGSSGIDYARAARSILSEEVREHFDVVGFDPRGVGESAPVKCLNDTQLDEFLALDTTPDSPQEQAALERGSHEFAQGCQARSGRLLPHIGTADTARDLDALRLSLGDRQLTYLGKSYGSFLGAIYADMYPANVRALVLDGAVDPALSRLRLNADQGDGFELALRAYIANCLAEDASPFRSHEIAGALNELSALLRRTDSHPLPTANAPTDSTSPDSTATAAPPTDSETTDGATTDGHSVDGDSADIGLGGGRKVTEALATLGILTPLYDRNSWPVLTETLHQALHGDGTLLLRNADQLTGRQDDGTYSNQTEANLAINCLDGPYPPDTSAYATAATESARTAPHFGAYLTWSSLPCAHWPARPTLQPRPTKAGSANPVLVLGTKRDPATPYPWAQSLTKELPSRLLTFNGDGHTAYFNGSSCVDSIVDHYLLTTALPPHDAICPGIG